MVIQVKPSQPAPAMKVTKVITVNPSTSLKTCINAKGADVEYPTDQHTFAKAYLKALRPHQWLKNLLVFIPILASHQLTVETLGQSLLAFVAFSFVASSVYGFNDLLDLTADRAHPRKRNRPLASGALPIAHGTWLALLLSLSGFVLALPLGASFVLVMLAYLATTTAYSLYLKRLVIIDICALTSFFVMRIIAGGVATGIPLSFWLLAFSVFFFFALAAIKRQSELFDGIASTASGRGYRVDDLPLVASMATASGYVSVLVVMLYLTSPEVLELYGYPQALWGIGFVLLYWLSRMVIIAHRGNMHDDPLVFAVKDRVSLMCFFLIAAFLIGAVLL